MKNDGHDMRALGYLLNRWGRTLELMRFWHGFPTIESVYRAFFGPSAFSSGRIPIPDIEADIVRINLRILALKQSYQDALIVFYGYSAKPEGGYFTDADKGRMLRLSEVELKSRLYFAKKQLLSNLKVVQSSNLRSCHSAA